MRFRSQHHEHDEGTERIEAFSDGVFAIAITLLIIEIGVPVLTADESLSHALRHLWPEYAAYVLSFVMIGIYWANHNSFFKHFVRSDHFFLMINVFFLMAIAFVPFPTAVLGEYLDNDPERKTAVIFYIIGLLLPAIGWLSIWVYGNQDHLIDENLDPDYIRFLSFQFVGSTAIYLIALIIAIWLPYVGLIITAALTALYLLPPRPRQYITQTGDEPL
jgi:uncharacterized membrane protein